MTTPEEQTAIAVLDDRISQTTAERDRLWEMAQRLPSVEANLAALIRVRALLLGEHLATVGAVE